MIGSSLSHFRITAKLGEGGMGEVYRAEDTKLGRDVAIKVLPEAVSSDPERMARFQREAKVLALLNHTNIAAIYSLESAMAGTETGHYEAESAKAGTEAGHYEAESAKAGTETGHYEAESAKAGTEAGHYEAESAKAGTEAGHYEAESAKAGTEAGHYEAESAKAGHYGEATEGTATETISFLVMELVEGEDLQARISKGPIPIDEVLPMALQVAEALEAAHEKGVVHRDLKPANVKVTPDRQVKVLDFGLAKALTAGLESDDSAGTEAGHFNLSLSPTLTAQMTQVGVILGTASYMAPEQARGEEVDKRADIWAFGVLLFEMLTGQKSFDGKTVTDVIAAVVTRDPDWTALPVATPGPLRRLMVRCTRKEPHERLHDIADARLELAEGIANPESWSVDSGQMTVEGPRASNLGWWIAAAMALVAAGVLVWALGNSTEISAVADPVWFRFNDPPAMVAPLPNSIGVSSDGRKIAYTAETETDLGLGFQLQLRSLGSLEPEAIPGGEFSVGPFFSPDGERLGFFSLLDNKLKLVELESGAVTSLVQVSGPRGAVWREDDVIFYGPDTEAGIWRINSDGSENAQVTFPDAEGGERSHRYPDLLPDGKTILFTVATSEILTFGEARIDALNLETGVRTTLVENGSFGRFVEPSYLLYSREGSLMAIFFDPGTLETSGRSVKVVEGVVTSPLTGGADFDVGAGGTLAYLAGEEVNEPRQLVWLDRAGNAELVTEDELPYQSAMCAPDGGSVVLDIDAANANIWMLELGRRTMLRLTPSRSNNQPIWTPDGQRVAFSSSGGDGRKPYWQGIDGSAPPEMIPAPDGFWWPRSFTPDGEELVASLEAEGQSNMDIWVLPVSEGEAYPLIATKHNEDFGRVSPDGNWIAYQSDETGSAEVYIQAYPGLGSKIRVSRNGGEVPVWSHDGQELFYASGLAPVGVKFMSVPVELGPPLRAGAPEELFETDMFPLMFDVCPDGRFLLIRFKQTLPTVHGIDVAVGWTRTLPQLVPR